MGVDDAFLHAVASVLVPIFTVFHRAVFADVDVGSPKDTVVYRLIDFYVADEALPDANEFTLS